jgi:hypothetical protein
MGLGGIGGTVSPPAWGPAVPGRNDGNEHRRDHQAILAFAARQRKPVWAPRPRLRFRLIRAPEHNPSVRDRANSGLQLPPPALDCRWIMADALWRFVRVSTTIRPSPWRRLYRKSVPQGRD